MIYFNNCQIKKLVFIVLFFIFGLLIFSQENVRFDHLSIEEGLSQVTVRSIIQDKMGYMWFATEDGVNRYNGYEFTVFKNEIDNPFSISNNIATIIYEDSYGFIWVGTRDGLNRFDPETDQFQRFFTTREIGKNQRNSINIIYEDKNKLLWVGTSRRGLLKYDPKTKKWKRFLNDLKDKNSLGNNTVTDICEDNSKKIWIGTVNGLDKFNPDTGFFSHYRNQADDQYSLSNNRITSIIRNGKDDLLIGTWGGGINILSTDTGKFEQFRPEKNSTNNKDKYPYLNWSRTIFKDEKGEIWVGTANGGLIKILSFKKGLYEQYRFKAHKKYSLSGESIIAITEDRSGNLWIGSEINGINIFKDQKQQFSHFKIDNILNLGNSISGFFKETNDVLWYGTKAALARYDKRKQWENRTKYFYRIPDKNTTIGSSSINVIYKDSFKNLWVGTNGGGLNRFDYKTEDFVRYRNIPGNIKSISDNQIFCVIEDQNTNLWIGTSNGGLNMYKRNTNDFIQYKKDINITNSIGSNNIGTIVNDIKEKDILWVGTRNSGIDRFDSKLKSFSHFRHIDGEINSLSSNKVSTIYIASGSPDILWIGTHDGGLNKYSKKSKKWTLYTEKNGLANNCIYGILEDNKNNLWISTNNGLSKFKIVKETFTNYFEEDGLQGNEFNSFSFYKDKDGLMYFGGLNGFTYFLPDNIKTNKNIPQIVLTDFKKFNKKIKLNVPVSKIKNIKLTYKDIVFSFEFAALEYTNSKKNKYAYKLVGFNKDWIYTGAENRVATFTNIPHGSYIFKVKASNNDRIWNEKGITVNIIISPPFWKTWWFKSILAVTFLFLLFFLHKKRVKIIQTKLKREITVNELCINYNISKREKEVIDLLLLGKSNKEIEDNLFISIGTVKNHIYNIFKKLNVNNRNELFLKFKSS